MIAPAIGMQHVDTWAAPAGNVAPAIAGEGTMGEGLLESFRSFETTLPSGLCVRVGPFAASDRRLLAVGFDGLSERSRYFRFLRHVKALSDAEIASLSDVDGPLQKAVGAMRIGGPRPMPVGLARYVCLADTPEVAELAVTVVDDCHHKGLGSLLIGVIAYWAARNGVRAFAALVHGENQAMLRLLRRLGASGARGSCGAWEFSLPLFRDAGRYPDNSAGDAMRAAYSLVQSGFAGKAVAQSHGE